MGSFVCSSRTTLPAPPSCSVLGWICKLNQQAPLPSRWQSVWPMGNPSRKTPSGKQDSEAGCLYLVSSLPGCSGLAVLPSSTRSYFQSDSPSYNESYFVGGLVITLCLAPLDLWPLYLADIFVNGPSWNTSLLPYFSVPSVSHLDETVIKIACESGRQAKICPGSAWRLNLTSISRWRKRNWGNYTQVKHRFHRDHGAVTGVVQTITVTAEGTSKCMGKEKPHLFQMCTVSYEVWKRNVTLMGRGAITHSASPYPSASWPCLFMTSLLWNTRTTNSEKNFPFLTNKNKEYRIIPTDFFNIPHSYQNSLVPFQIQSELVKHNHTNRHSHFGIIFT